jgi:hypothetical protein
MAVQFRRTGAMGYMNAYQNIQRRNPEEIMTM